MRKRDRERTIKVTMGKTNKKADEFEQRIRRLFSNGTPKSEQDMIRAWLLSDEDADLKRDVLCGVMLSQFEAGTDFDAVNWEDTVRAPGLDVCP